MENEKFEKKMIIQGYRAIDFKPEDGERFQACKILYSYMSNKENQFGLQFAQINLPYDYCDKLKDCKFPLDCILVFSVDDFTKKPDIIELKINKQIYNK